MMSGRDTDAVHEEEILRGGTTIGYLERACAALGILAGFPGAVAIVVALKGVGRFTELATPAAREIHRRHDGEPAVGVRRRGSRLARGLVT
jgi:hypothetical protein